MTKKDFELLAEIMRESGGDFRSNTAHAAHAGMMAERLATTNPRFDRSKFILACMPRWMVGTNKCNVWERMARNV